MSEAEKTENGMNALLEELQSIRNVLDAVDSTDADKPGSDKTEQTETSTMRNQIPLLQDIIDPEWPGEDIQLEQSRTADASIISDQAQFGLNGIAHSDSQSDPEVDPYVPDELYPQNELPIFAEDSLHEAPDQDQIETTYSEYQDLRVSEDTEPTAPLAGLSRVETDEFIDLVIAEHVDEILDLFRAILRDKLSLLMVQFRDTPSRPASLVKREVDLPDFGDEDSNRNL